MLDFEIEKFKKVLLMKRYSIIRKLREDFPELEFCDNDMIEDRSFTREVLVSSKEPSKCKYYVVLKPDLQEALRAITNLNMYDAPERWKNDNGILDIKARKAKETVSILFSSIFQYEMGDVDGMEGLSKMFEMCTSEILSRTSGSYCRFFTTYERIVKGVDKSDVTDAMIKCKLEYSGRTGRDELIRFTDHQKQISDALDNARREKLREYKSYSY